MSRILIVDDDKALARSLEIHVSGKQAVVRVAHSLKEAREKFEAEPDDIVFLDLKLPDGDSRSLLTRMRDVHPRVLVIMISGHQDMQATIEAMQLGAFDYIRKPLDLDHVLATLAKAEERLRAKPKDAMESSLARDVHHRREIVGRSAGIMNVLKQIAELSKSRVTVLIEGETGTGKELVARALHESSQPSGPFVAVNCGGIVPTLLESELFGHEKGAFTGASTRKIGKVEFASSGTIFFDEVGDLPLDLQAKLLRALQEQEFERVGGVQPIPWKARVMAATHRVLEKGVREGTFRQDLYFRLAVARIRVPPLRDRLEDLPLLADFQLGRIAQQLGRPIASLTPEALEKLRRHPWTGNVRELENALTRAVAELRGDVIGPEELKLEPPPEFGAGTSLDAAEVLPLREVERRYVKKVLDRMGWNITQTAAVLEISPTTLRKKIADFGLGRSDSQG